MRGTNMTGWIMKEHNVPESLVTVLKLADQKSPDGHLMWECQCECGNLFIENGRKLREGRVLSCGCFKKEYKKDKTKKLSTPKIIEYKGKQINTQYWTIVKNEEREQIKKDFFQVPDYSEVITQFKRLQKGGPKMDKVNRYYFRELMAATKNIESNWSVEEIFESNDLVGMFKSIVESGSKKVFQETRTLAQNIEKAIGLSSYARFPTNYPLQSVEKILSTYNVNNNWYDFSCGWGARLIGAMRNNINYFGTDPNNLLCEKLKQLQKDYSSVNKVSSTVEIYCNGSEIFNPEWENKIGLAFSSPPYFNFEDYKYGEQSYRPGMSYEDWKENYLRPTFKNIYKYLIDNGYFLINIKNLKKYPLVEDSLKIAQECGFIFKEVVPMDDNIQRPNINDYVEPILVFTKS